jgi:hypothetical protein
MVALAVDSGREAAFSLGGLACLLVAGTLITVVVVTRPDWPDWSALRRWMWRLGTVAGAVCALAGGGLIAADAVPNLDR